MARIRATPGIELGRILHEYSPTETNALTEQWLAAFAPNGFGQGSRQYLWHVFSFGATPALEGAQALAHYERKGCARYVVLANDRQRKKAFLTDSRPVRSTLEDWFVFPPNLAWTMAFTHEDGWIGPFFALHPEHARLDADNRAELGREQARSRSEELKQREIEKARRRGWI